MQKRFANTVREYALAAVNLIHNREEKRSPGIDEFIAMRRGTSAVEVLVNPGSLFTRLTNPCFTDLPCPC